MSFADAQSLKMRCLNLHSRRFSLHDPSQPSDISMTSPGSTYDDFFLPISPLLRATMTENRRQYSVPLAPPEAETENAHQVVDCVQRQLTSTEAASPSPTPLTGPLPPSVPKLCSVHFRVVGIAPDVTTGGVWRGWPRGLSRSASAARSSEPTPAPHLLFSTAFGVE